MPCPEPRLLHAYVDGELDAEGVIALDAHLAGCAACREAVAAALALRAGLASLPYYTAPPALRARLSRALPADPLPPATGRWAGYWAGAISGAAAAAVAGVLLVTGIPGREAPVVDDILASHLRSLLPGRLIDVESSDRHTVKPWFAGHADVSPPVADFPEQDFRLVGGRVDYVDGRRAAVVVYRHGPHLINVYTWSGGDTRLPGATADRNGYHVRCWRSAALASCAISDTAPGELAVLVGLITPLATAARE